MMERTHIEIGWATLFRIVTLGLILLGLYLASSVVGVFFIGVVISLGLDPIVGYLEKRKIPRILGTLIVFILSISLLAGFIYFIIPVVTQEAGGFGSFVSGIFASLDKLELPQPFSSNLNLSLSDALGIFSSVNSSVAQTVASIFSNILLIMATILTSFYLTVDRDGTERLLRVMLPSIYEGPILKVFVRFKLKIRKWFGAQLLLSVIMGLVVGVGLWIMGVPYPLMLGILAAIFELVPMIGSILIGLISFGVAITQSFSLGLYAVLFFVIVQQLENHVLVPIVMGRSLRVHPVIVVVGILAGGMIAGFIGLILAVPVAVLMQEIFEHLAEKKSRRPALEI
jgi:predicted PurR-regulated permease PerM